MSELSVQRETLVLFFKDILKKDPSILQEVLAKLKEEGTENDRSRRVAAIIESDFARFDEVFKALA